MSQLIEEYLRNNQIGQYLGMEFNIIEQGHVEYYLTTSKHLEAIKGMTHGGAIAGFMDGILGVAALSEVESENKLVATIEFKINYMKPVFTNEKLIGVGKVLQRGKSTLVVEGKIMCGMELKVCALGTFKAYHKDNKK